MNERLSAWLDGELDGPERTAVFQDVKATVQRAEDVSLAFLIGDALRGDMALRPDFMGRFRDALAAEPVILAPAAANAVAGKEHARKRFVALSAAASVAAVATIGWFAIKVNPSGSLPASAVVARAPAVVAPAQPASRLAENERMLQFLAMHQEASSYQPVAVDTLGQ